MNTDELFIEMITGTTAELKVSRMYPNNGGRYFDYAYEADGRFFRENKQRHFRLRAQFYKEFDAELENAGSPTWNARPELWCLVERFGEGVHRVTPVYRGSPFFDVSATVPRFAKHNTDAECGLTLLRMEAAGGRNKEQVESWFAQFQAKAVSEIQMSLAQFKDNKVVN